MIAIEGTEFRARMIPRKDVMSVWRMLTQEPFPRVTAFRLEDRDFDRAMELMRRTDAERRGIEECRRVRRMW